MDINDIRDNYVRLAQEATYGLNVTFLLPGTNWAEYFPFLLYLPTWLPGSSYRRTLNYYRPIVEEMRDRPYEKTLEDMVR